mgnify:CR=1 FL=1
MEKGSLKGAQMRAFYFLPQNIYVNHPAIFDKYFYFFDKYTCQRYNNDNNTCQKKGGSIETS